MGLIQADLDGLSGLAAACQAQTVALADAGAIPQPTAPVHATPTTTAIATAQAEVSAAAARFTQRMKASAAGFVAAAADFAATETDSVTSLEQVT